MVRNDAFFLRKWTAYYGAQLGEENLYVYLDGKDQPLPDWCPKAHIIPCDRVCGQVVRADKGRIRFLSARAFSQTCSIMLIQFPPVRSECNPFKPLPYGFSGVS